MIFKLTGRIGRILVPIDSTAETIQKLPFVAKLAKVFNSEVHVIATHYSNLKSIRRITGKYAQQAVQYLKENKVRYFFDDVVTEDVTKEILTNADMIEADLIAIMTDQKTHANILLGPQSQQIINQSHQPVLSMHPQEQFCLSMTGTITGLFL